MTTLNLKNNGNKKSRYQKIRIKVCTGRFHHKRADVHIIACVAQNPPPPPPPPPNPLNLFKKHKKDTTVHKKADTAKNSQLSSPPPGGPPPPPNPLNLFKKKKKDTTKTSK